MIPTLDQSGAEKQLSLLATSLPREDFDVRVVALTRGGYYEQVLRDADVPVDVLGKRWKLDPLTLWRLRRAIESYRPHIVHSWLFTANAYTRLVVAPSHDGPKVVVSERCVDSWKAAWQAWLDRRQIPRTTRLIANAQCVADFYADRGFPSERLTVIPNGITLPHKPADAERLRRELEIPADVHLVGYVGRLAPQKRVPDLIWGMQLLHLLRDDVFFLVVGDGPDATRIVDQLDDYDVRPKVRLTGHRSDAAELLRLLDVFWLGSDFEGMSNSIMEAMAAGIPVVCSDIPANRELVVDGETGFLVRPGDSVGFSQFTDRILADPQLKSRLGDAGRTRITERFSVDSMVAAHVDVYRELAGR